MNWIKRHKFWTGIVIALAVGFAIERLTGAEVVYTVIYWAVGVAIATWLLFKLDWTKLFGRPKHEGETKEAP